jgi:tripartite ATP-independent transporter DctM subunit
VVGLLAIPVMLKYAYDKGLISGTICAGGSLGTIIPPSVVVVILGPVADVSVGDLFVGMLIPGLMLAGLYIVYIIARCTVFPLDGPRLPPDENEPPFLQKLWITAHALVPPLMLIFSVLGTIMLGWATPTEAAAMGAIGTVILTLIYGSFNFTILQEAFLKTLQITAMILMILLGGTMFAGVFVALGGISAVKDILDAANLTAMPTMIILLALAFVAGFVLDLISIILIIIPVAMAVLRVMGVNDVWFCIMFLIMIQTSYLTPPMAPAIFYLRGISPPEIKLSHMYRGVIPFIGLELVVLALVAFFPGLALWLPEVVFAR